MTTEENQIRRIDVLAIGLFGLAVGALTLGIAQLGWISHKNTVGALVIALIFGGIVQLLAGITDIRYNEQLGGTALTMYGFLWITLCTVKLVNASGTFQFDNVLYAPINFVYAVFSGVMVYLTAYRNLTLSALHVIITLTFLATTFARLDFISELLPGIGHIVVGLMAFYHAVGSLTQAFTGQALVPLGPPLLIHRRTTVSKIAKVM
ncbi:MAG: acetate uptake transporter [Nitrospiraceae bacterium]|nr:acetate uptake transporter [Nitrospiraceae bacterium]